jgi:signal transduction histidine kinase
MHEEKVALQAENLRILSEQKSILRQAILERTEEILAQNEQLVRNQEHIQSQNERLETQNKAYERLREMVLRQNQDLETAVRKRTLDLAKANEELRTTVQKLERFSYITAHNLRGPVARILGLSSLIDKRNLASSENQVIIERLQSSAKDLDVVIHDIGSILAIQQGKVDDFEEVNFEELVVRVLSEFGRDIEDHNLDVRLACSVGLIDTIPASLESILANLISNSIKYRSDVRPPVIEINVREDEESTHIAVSDNGIGFDSKGFADKLFEPFQRFHTHNQGKGLGLFLIKAQVSLLGGSIQLTSQVNHGVRVEIVLPKKRVGVLAQNR